MTDDRMTSKDNSTKKFLVLLTIILTIVLSGLGILLINFTNNFGHHNVTT